MRRRQVSPGFRPICHRYYALTSGASHEIFCDYSIFQGVFQSILDTSNKYVCNNSDTHD
jgi:hypothetical protein